jgi:hypothetical protein
VKLKLAHLVSLPPIKINPLTLILTRIHVSAERMVSNWGENMPKWNQQSLKTHFDKRISKDAACLQDVLGRPVASITEADYERESMTVLSTAWICYSGEATDQRYSRRDEIVYFAPAKHFVDERLLTTIVSHRTDTVLTCYHEHFDRPHRTSQKKLEQMVKYVERLGDQRRGNMLRNFSVDRFVPPTGAPVALGAELARVKAIPEKPVPSP